MNKAQDINIEIKEFDKKCKLLQNWKTLVKEYLASHQINLQILEINKKSINNEHDILNSFDDFSSLLDRINCFIIELDPTKRVKSLTEKYLVNFLAMEETLEEYNKILKVLQEMPESGPKRLFQSINEEGNIS